MVTHVYSPFVAINLHGVAIRVGMSIMVTSWNNKTLWQRKSQCLLFTYHFAEREVPIVGYLNKQTNNPDSNHLNPFGCKIGHNNRGFRGTERHRNLYVHHSSDWIVLRNSLLADNRRRVEPKLRYCLSSLQPEWTNFWNPSFCEII